MMMLVYCDMKNDCSMVASGLPWSRLAVAYWLQGQDFTLFLLAVTCRLLITYANSGPRSEQKKNVGPDLAL